MGRIPNSLKSWEGVEFFFVFLPRISVSGRTGDDVVQGLNDEQGTDGSDSNLWLLKHSSISFENRKRTLVNLNNIDSDIRNPVGNADAPHRKRHCRTNRKRSDVEWNHGRLTGVFDLRTDREVPIPDRPRCPKNSDCLIDELTGRSTMTNQLH